jgi:hypothetical protein
MGDTDAAALDEFVAHLLTVTVQEGMPRQVATDCCRALTLVTVNDAIRNARTSNRAANNQVNHPSNDEFAQEFEDTLRLILAGVRAESSNRASAWAASMLGWLVGGVTAALRFDPENVRMVDNIRYP